MKWLLIGVAGLLAGCDTATHLTLGHGPDEPAGRLAETLHKDFVPTFDLELKQYDNMQQLLVDLQSQRLSLAIVEQPRAPLPDLRVVTPLYRSVLHVLVRKSINDCSRPVVLAELIQRGSVYAGPPGSAGRQLLESMAAAGWLPAASELQLLPNPLIAEPDIFLQFGSILSQDAESRLTGYCLASLGDVNRLGRGSWAEGLSYRYPYLTPLVLPAGIYPSLNPEAVLSLAVTHLLVTHNDMAPDVIHDTLNLVKEHANELGALDPMVGATIHEDFADDRLNLPLHPGTQRYLQRNAPSFLERYAELLAFILTALIATSSAGVAIVRIRRQAKKDRIDAYLQTLIDIRQQLHSGACSATELASTVATLQAKVTQLVVEERLMADTTFVAFLSLSNQILNEARDAS